MDGAGGFCYYEGMCEQEVTIPSPVPGALDVLFVCVTVPCGQNILQNRP